MTDIIPAILMILTSAAQMDSTTPTGLWYEEFAAPYEIFIEAGWSVTVASVDGGKAPVDPRSITELTAADSGGAAMRALENTLALKDVDALKFDALFFPGGHGTMMDFPNNEAIAATIQKVLVNQEGVVAAVCHGPAAFVGATRADGEPLVKGRSLTGFTNEEEQAVQLDAHVPFLLETKLRELGARFVPGAKFKEHVVADGNLITGQNPASSAATARALVKAVEAIFAERAAAAQNN